MYSFGNRRSLVIYLTRGVRGDTTILSDDDDDDGTKARVIPVAPVYFCRDLFAQLWLYGRLDK